MPPEVFVTGVGIVSPAGLTAERTWSALLAGERCIRPLLGVDLAGCRTEFGGQVPAFSPPAGTEKWDRLCQLAAAAADNASGLLFDHCRDAVVCIGTSKGGIESFANTSLSLINPPTAFSSGSLLRTPLYSTAAGNWPLDIRPDAPAARIAGRLGAAAGSHAGVAACATGTLAIIRGAQFIEDGDAEMVICGGADASLHALWLAAFEQMGVLAPLHANFGPAWACRPFDADRSGFALGEGAGVLVLESSTSIKRTGSQALARIAGHARGTDPTGLATLDESGAPLAQIIRLACGRAGCRPDELACVYAHGTGTPANDRAEARAIRAVLGPAAARIPLLSVKGAIGHLLGAAGAVELALAVLACTHGQSPGNVTLLRPDPEMGDLNLPSQAFRLARGPILKTALGFGGHLAAVVLQPA